MQRLWLTPVFRALLRIGLPAFVLMFGAGLYLSDAERRAAIVGGLGRDLRDKVEERPEFLVNLLAVEGASPALAEAVRAKLDAAVAAVVLRHRPGGRSAPGSRSWMRWRGPTAGAVGRRAAGDDHRAGAGR